MSLILMLSRSQDNSFIERGKENSTIITIMLYSILLTQDLKHRSISMQALTILIRIIENCNQITTLIVLILPPI